MGFEAPSNQANKPTPSIEGILTRAKPGIVDWLPTVHGPARLRKLLGLSRREMAEALVSFGAKRRPAPSTVSNWERRERSKYDKRFRVGKETAAAYKRLIAHVCETVTAGEWTAVVHNRVYWRVELREAK